MAVLGPYLLMDNAFPTGVDAALLARLALEEGLSQDAAVAQAADIIGTRNQEIMNRYGGVLAQTGRRDLEYRAGTGSRSMLQKSAELSRNFVEKGLEAGHMLPRDDFDGGVDYSDNFARRGNAQKFMLGLQQLADDWENRVDYDIILRALTSTEVSVGAGYSVGWAIGSGGNDPFIPPQWRGALFDSTHTHFIFLDSAASKTYGDLFTQLLLQLRHHGHSGRATILTSNNATDITAITALAGFVSLEQPRVIVNNASTGAPVRFMEDAALADNLGVPGEVYGYFNSPGYGIAELRTHTRIPQHYAFATKSYGIGNAKNGLAMYVENPLGFGLMVEPRYVSTPELKLERIRVMATHGIGVNDRTNGVAGYLASGASSYVDPTSLIAA